MSDFKRINNSLNRKSRIKECFCANSQCDSDIIKAHSIQNNRILKKISENGYVIQFKPADIDGNFSMEPEKVGRKIATVSTNFCGFHDTKIFSPIELKDYKKNDKEQEFLFAYRAFAREYHVKRESKNFLENLGKSERFKHENRFATQIKITELTLKQMEREKTLLNKALSNSDFGIFYTYIIEFHGFYGIAVSSTFAIEYDLEGNLINNLLDLNKEMKSTFLSIFPQGNKTFILLSCFRKNKKAFSFISNQIMKRSVAEQKIIISNLILNHAENFAISPELWRRFLPEQQMTVKKMWLRMVATLDNRLFNLIDINLFI